MAEIVTIDIADTRGFFAGSSCVFGVFDGFHLGHRFLVDCALETKPSDGRAIAITFDIDPDEVFAPRRLKKLLPNGERLRLLSESGVDAIAVLPFTPAFASQAPQQFLDTVFGSGAPSFLHVGEDFRFGSHGTGSVDDLAGWGESRGMSVVGHPLFRLDGEPVTATRIRALLADGNVLAASRLLGRPYSLTGTVVRGRGSGHEFGIPTANLDIPLRHISCRDGVYGCRCTVEGRAYNAAVCVGIPPTFESCAKQPVEVHIIDFDGDIYGQTLTIDFVQFIRENRVFGSIGELVDTLRANIATIRETQPL